ncbi:putative histidine phosphotransferase HPT1p [Saitoella complicata NRRL Y-17804]|nr:putative histidine phosphotransferase HPT1p [Saitoella complicata NRRL Y-17804]ODQ56402.1 putative histidine phosphotransferase HPT1p [Saitoella complicata NRRL Y-17804]
MSNAAEDREETTPNAADEAGDLIDHNTFDQLLEMDDEDDREFSRSIVWNYFEQADTTFVEMETALSEKDLDQLSSLGHFLKGSSAALGLTKVKASCERIQHFGAKKDESGTEPIDEETAMKRIEEILPVVKQEYAEAEKYLRKFYGDDA